MIPDQEQTVLLGPLIALVHETWSMSQDWTLVLAILGGLA